MKQRGLFVLFMVEFLLSGCTTLNSYDSQKENAVNIVAFWDINANGIFNQDDILLNDVIVSSKNEKCKTSFNGTCKLLLNLGVHILSIDSTKATNQVGEKISNLDYLFWGTDIIDPKKGLTVSIDKEMDIFVALAQGPYPVPSSQEGFDKTIYKAFGEIWEGESEPHGAIDLLVLGEDDPLTDPVIIYANVTGIIEPIPDSTDHQPFGPCGLIVIKPDDDQDVPPMVFQTGHLTGFFVEPGQHVVRGQPIAEIDARLFSGRNRVACTYPPHLEFTLWEDKWIDPLLYSPIIGQLVFSDYDN